MRFAAAAMVCVPVRDAAVFLPMPSMRTALALPGGESRTMRYLWSSSAMTLASAFSAAPSRVNVPSNSPMMGSNGGSDPRDWFAARAVAANARAESVHAVRSRTLRNMMFSQVERLNEVLTAPVGNGLRAVPRGSVRPGTTGNGTSPARNGTSPGPERHVQPGTARRQPGTARRRPGTARRRPNGTSPARTAVASPERHVAGPERHVAGPERHGVRSLQGLARCITLRRGPFRPDRGHTSRATLCASRGDRRKSWRPRSYCPRP